METPEDANVAALKEEDMPSEQVPQTEAGTPERESALREWGRQEGTRVFLDWVRTMGQERKRWFEDAMRLPGKRDDTEDVLLNERARTRAIEYRAEATVFGTVEMLLVGQITRAGAASPTLDAKLREMGQACLDWAKDTGECHFCDYASGPNADDERPHVDDCLVREYEELAAAGVAHEPWCGKSMQDAKDTGANPHWWLEGLKVSCHPTEFPVTAPVVCP